MGRGRGVEEGAIAPLTFSKILYALIQQKNSLSISSKLLINVVKL